MWGRSMVVLIFWFAILFGVTKLFRAVTLNPFNSHHDHPAVTMILVGCSFLLSAMAIKKISRIFSRILSKQKERKKMLTVNTRPA